MNAREIQAALRDVPLGGLRFFESIGSTNDEALAWATVGAFDLSLVLADEQTAGRGRRGRKWHTPPESALAFSVILRPSAGEQKNLARLTALGALALADALRARGLTAQIKWPNDVLVDGRKLAGLLVESVWTGESLDAAVLGMGVNVLSGSVPPNASLQFPATSLEDALRKPVDRLALLHDILAALLIWRPRLASDSFIAAWEERLAFRGEQVQVWKEDETAQSGELLGLEQDGSLRLRGTDGRLHTVQFGEIHLRPAA
jgi:BirA family biotin operon repressor/biotin-[acetyl-CoA-carboxylase] ligase